ncbi:MAG: hypothetical protein C5B56_03550 [Proteobacteria bacterium]|nr:MAG: hypothetical protein C5B56_03550 [Pseudomonadota bacterium]
MSLSAGNPILRKYVWSGLLLLCISIAALGVYYVYSYRYAFNMLLRHGPFYWASIERDDPRLSPAIRLALGQAHWKAVPGRFEWREIDRGFAVAELPVLVNDQEIDRMLLARIGPADFRFIVRNSPAGNDVDEWMQQLGAVLVVNGSYFVPDGTPATPIMSSGTMLGPANYNAKHGAFIAASGFAAVRDLSKQHWRDAVDGASDAMVSYPLLVTKDGTSRVTADRDWLANRSFVGQDVSGQIIIGTTADALFSLDRLAEFLQHAPLNLTIALNLDGGGVACQGIAVKDYRRSFCGKWELNTRGGGLKAFTWTYGDRPWALPIALAAVRK